LGKTKDFFYTCSRKTRFDKQSLWTGRAYRDFASKKVECKNSVSCLQLSRLDSLSSLWKFEFRSDYYADQPEERKSLARLKVLNEYQSLDYPNFQRTEKQKISDYS